MQQSILNMIVSKYQLFNLLMYWWLRMHLAGVACLLQEAAVSVPLSSLVLCLELGIQHLSWNCRPLSLLRSSACGIGPWVSSAWKLP